MKEEELISRIIVGTKRRKRPFSVIEIADYINELNGYLKNLKEVSEVVGISENMLRRFLVVRKLHPNIINLFRNRIIDEVTSGYYLNRFTLNEQELLSHKILDKEINSRDIRSLGAFRNQFPQEDILSLVDRLMETKNRKVSIAYFFVEDEHINLDRINKALLEIISQSDLVDIYKKDRVVTIKISKAAEKILRQKARNEGLKLREYLENKILKYAWSNSKILDSDTLHKYLH